MKAGANSAAHFNNREEGTPSGLMPTGKRNRGRPKTTWRRTITTELSDMGLTMGEAQVIAPDRHRWRRDIVALCPTLG